MGCNFFISVHPSCLSKSLLKLIFSYIWLFELFTDSKFFNCSLILNKWTYSVDTCISSPVCWPINHNVLWYDCNMDTLHWLQKMLNLKQNCHPVLSLEAGCQVNNPPVLPLYLGTFNVIRLFLKNFFAVIATGKLLFLLVVWNRHFYIGACVYITVNYLSDKFF